MDEIASLRLRVESLEIDKANKRLDQIPGKAQKAEKATDGLTSGFKRLVGALIALETARQGLDKLVEVQRTFDKLNAGLLTATGSTEKAAQAFDALNKFAMNTPYGLEQSVEAFTKLVNLGLTPSERALTSYGNTAAAMGKDLNQMIEAVADAATGEFERLKEFGIKSKNQGDTIAFTFQGTTKTVKNNAKEIEEYLLRIGEVNFAGAMAKRMDSLDGDIANLSDTWDNLYLNISKQGVGDLIRDTVQIATKALTELNAQVASGELKGYLDASVHAFDSWATDVKTTIDFIDKAYHDLFVSIGKEGESGVDWLIDAFARFPQNVRAFIQLMTTEVAAGFDRAKSLAVLFKESAEAIFSEDTMSEVNARYAQRNRIIDQARMDSISGILEERDKDIAATDARVEAAKKLREEYDKTMEARKKNTADQLAQYKIQSQDGPAGPTKAEEAAAKKAQREAEALAKKNQQEYQAVVDGLRTQEEAIQASYQRRLDIITRNTEAESSIRKDLTARLEKDRQKELDDLYNIEQAYEKQVRLAQEVASIQQSMWTDAQQAAYDYQKQIETLWQAMMAGTISTEEHERLVNDVTKAYEKQGKKGVDTFLSLEEMGKKASQNIQDAFADFLFSPFEGGLKGMLASFTSMLGKMAAQAAAANIMGSITQSAKTGWLGTVIGAAGAVWGGIGSSGAAASSAMGASQAGYTNYDLSNFVPGRAAGGPTEPGRLYRVNEFEPEMFSAAGRDYLLAPTAGVVKNAQSTGGGNTITFTQSVQVNNNGQTTTDSTQSEDTSAATQFSEKMRQAALQVIIDEQRPGGYLYQGTA